MAQGTRLTKPIETDEGVRFIGFSMFHDVIEGVRFKDLQYFMTSLIGKEIFSVSLLVSLPVVINKRTF